jgi:hypothetical protein
VVLSRLIAQSGESVSMSRSAKRRSQGRNEMMMVCDVYDEGEELCQENERPRGVKDKKGGEKSETCGLV